MENINIETFIKQFKFSSYYFYENPEKNTDAILGKITIHCNNKSYNAYHSEVYPKIIYKNNVYENIGVLLSYIRKKNSRSNNK